MPREPKPIKEPNRPERATIGDVAALAGVSRPTVSAILNERSYCYASAQTRQRVTDAAAQLGYRASPMARAMMGKATATVGLVTGGFDVEMSAIKFAAFEAAGREHGKMTIAAFAPGGSEKEDEAIRWLMDRYVDGLVVYPTEHGPHAELCRLANSGFPVVTFDGAGRIDTAMDDVTGDYLAGGRLIIEHMLAMGRRKIGLIHALPGCFVNNNKIRGMELALKEAGLSFALRAELLMPVQTREHWKTDEFAQIRGVLSQNARKIDAVVCVGDAIAMATMQHAVALGMRVPDDLAVSGYDGSAMSGHALIPLTTVLHPSDEIGKQAFALLNERLSGERKARRPKSVLSAPILLARASTGSSGSDAVAPLGNNIATLSN
jgi:LacI family transcriptional regulator